MMVDTTVRGMTRVLREEFHDKLVPFRVLGEDVDNRHKALDPRDKLQAYLNAHKVTRTRAAQVLGVALSTLSRWMERKPKRCAEALRCLRRAGVWEQP